MESRKLKQIALKINAKGNGIVNNDYKTYLNKTIHKNWNDNTSFAKKSFYLDEKGNIQYKIQVSSDLIRSTVFNNTIKTPTLTHHKYLMCDYFSNIDSIMRGWFFGEKDTLGSKKKSAITLTKLTQTNNAVSYLEIGTKQGEIKLKDKINVEEETKPETDDTTKNTKKKKKKGEGSNSLRFVETIGDIEYSGDGFIDIQQLQFLSLDDMFDRLAFNPDYVPEFCKMFKNKYNYDINANYYTMTTDSSKLPEYGILLNDDIQNLLIKHFLKNLYNLTIKRSGSYLRLSELYYKPIYEDDSVKDMLDDENGWIKINNEKEIGDLNFEYSVYFVESNKDEITNKNDIINLNIKNMKKSKTNG